MHNGVTNCFSFEQRVRLIFEFQSLVTQVRIYVNLDFNSPNSNIGSFFTRLVLVTVLPRRIAFTCVLYTHTHTHRMHAYIVNDKHRLLIESM